MEIIGIISTVAGIIVAVLGILGQGRYRHLRRILGTLVVGVEEAWESYHEAGRLAEKIAVPMDQRDFQEAMQAQARPAWVIRDAGPKRSMRKASSSCRD